MNLTELKRICEAAPQRLFDEIATSAETCDSVDERTTVKFIATFNPALVAKLLAVVEAAKKLTDSTKVNAGRDFNKALAALRECLGETNG